MASRVFGRVKELIGNTHTYTVDHLLNTTAANFNRMATNFAASDTKRTCPGVGVGRGVDSGRQVVFHA